MFSFNLLIALCIIGATTASSSSSIDLKSIKHYPGQCAPTDQSTTKTCLDAHFKVFGIATAQGLPAFVDYTSKIADAIAEHGTTGLDFYCDADSALNSCLGKLRESACMNPDAFTKMYGLDTTNAIGYTSSYPVQSYTCQNTDFLKPYSSCLNEVYNDHFEGISKCNDDMQKEFKNTTDICSPVNRYVTCVENYYAKFCDNGILSYVCTTQEIALNFGMDGLCAEKMRKC